MTICVGLYSEARGWQGLALKGSSACWDCGLLREWHSGRRCPAGRASGGCSMVNRPFMAGPQSLLSRANSSSPAWRDGEGGGAPWRGGFFWGWGVPIFSPLSLSWLCSAELGGAGAREPHTNRPLLSSNNTKTLAELAKCWQTAAQHWKTPTISDSLKTSWSWNNLLGMMCKLWEWDTIMWNEFLTHWISGKSPKKWANWVSVHTHKHTFTWTRATGVLKYLSLWVRGALLGRNNPLRLVPSWWEFSHSQRRDVDGFPPTHPAIKPCDLGIVSY